MARTRFIEHQERQIDLMDFARLTDMQEARAAIEEARQFVAA
jgi:hypothetical protein